MNNKKILAIIEEVGAIDTSAAIVNWNLCKIIAPNFKYFDILTLDSISKDVKTSWKYGEVHTHPMNNLTKIQQLLLKIPKFRAILQICIGNDLNHYNRIKNIRIYMDVNGNRYDHILLLSGGGGFTPHHALNKKKYCNMSKIALIHDPYPASCYPHPYKSGNILYDYFKKKQLQKTFQFATKIIFPSKRLFEWYLKDYSIVKSKVKIIPHAVNFNHNLIREKVVRVQYKTIIHAGSLLKPRNPQTFLKVFSELDNNVKLEFYGNIEKSVFNEIMHFDEFKSISINNSRFEYSQILNKLFNSDYLLLIESNGRYNPFLPTKFVDYLNMSLPIIALTSANSEVSRLLGDDYPFKCELNDEAAIKEILKFKIFNKRLINDSLEHLNRLKLHFSKEFIENNYLEIFK